MSGILALLDRGVTARDAPPASGPFSRPDLLECLTGLMAYRAPDGSATWHRGPIGLGHALLRTHTRGEQPEPGVIHDEAAGLSIVADARLDAREELVRALRAAATPGGGGAPAGRPMALHVDTPAPQLLLAAWRAWGPACPAYLLGDFAFVIWDAPRNTLFAARDPFGVKPLYLTEVDGDDGWLVVSNTLPALLEHPGVSREPDERSVADYLFWGGIYDERRTYFAQVRQVERGSWLSVGPDGIEERRYWSLPEPGETHEGSGSRGETLERFEHLLRQAVADRLPEADHTAVLQLSGGLDSGTIACAAVDVRGGPRGLAAVTTGYERLFDDPEPPLARQVAATLGLDHTVQFADDWSEPLPGMAPGLPDWATRGTYPIGPGFDFADVDDPPMAALGPVTLTGWDGDALLYADPRGHLSRLVRQGRLLPLGSDLAALAREGLALRRPPRTGLRGALRGWLSSELDPMDGYPEGLLDPDFEKRCDLRERWRTAAAPTRGDSDGDPRLGARRALEGPVWSALFQEQDPGVTGHPIEARHPLLDLRLVRFLLALPAVPWCVEKGILRAYLRPRLPPSVWRRKKEGLQGDPLVLTLERTVATATGRSELSARLTLEPQDPLVARRLLIGEWHSAFLRASEADDGGGMWPYWGTRAHAVGRWLRSLEGRAPPRSGNGSSGDEGRQDNDSDPEAVQPA